MRKLSLVILAAFIISLMTGCGASNLVNSPEDVSGKVIGAVRGTPSERLANELGTASVFDSGEEMISNLISRTIDCAVMDHSAANELVSNTARVKVLNEPLLVYDLRFAVPKENSELLKAIDSAIASLRADGTLKGLRDKYFSGRKYSYSPSSDEAKRPGILTLAVPPDSPPFSVMDSNGDFSGLDVDVAHAVSGILGVELQIIEYDAWELVSAVQYGRADIALGWLPSEGEKLVNVSEPYAYVEYMVIVRR